MHSVFETLVTALADPIRAFIEPEKRVYLPYLLSSGLLAALVWARRARPRGVSLLRYLLPSRMVRHPSFWFDVRWLFVRAPIHALLVLPGRAIRVAVMLWIFGALNDTFGSSPELDLSRAGAVAIFSVACFVADDFTRYAVHRLMHRVPALWEIHKLHHSAEILTPITLYRVHPIESAINQLRGIVTVAAVSALCMWVLPGRLRAWEILGVEAIGLVWTVFGANLRHSHVWLSFGRILEHLVLSPAQHQLHHGRFTSGTNFGSALALWDWLGGSLRIAAGARQPRFGLPLAERMSHSVLDALVQPPLAALRALRPRRNVAPESAPPAPTSSS